MAMMQLIFIQLQGHTPSMKHNAPRVYSLKPQNFALE